MSAVMYEDTRFSRTGTHCGIHRMRPEFMCDALSGPLDAPEYIARGSLSAHLHSGNAVMPAYVYVCGTELRPGVLR